MQSYMTSARRRRSAWWARARRSSAILAFAAFAAACGGDDATGPNGGTPVTPVPSPLAGAWMYGTISPTNFWNDHTGQYSGNAYGIGVYLEFKPDGRYSQWVYIYTQQYSCRMQTWTHTEGTVVIAGSQITFYPTTGKYQASDTCVAKNNFTRGMTREELQAKQGETWGWEIDDSSGQPKLYTGPGGPSEFRRPG